MKTFAIFAAASVLALTAALPASAEDLNAEMAICDAHRSLLHQQPHVFGGPPNPELTEFDPDFESLCQTVKQKLADAAAQALAAKTTSDAAALKALMGQ